MNNVIMRVKSFFAIYFILPASFRQRFCLTRVMDGGHIHYIQGIEYISVERIAYGDHVREVLNIDVRGVLGKYGLALLVKLGLLRIVRAGYGRREGFVIVGV
ncbi:hypothetical protein SDC9_150222 [bioreactor metagenome]|uniref:Uncharacterized protein n=1 Tax=bioreactor metagenome TaxID=1076179 RepID=A0A645EPC1_9ZZZZ